LLLTFGIVEIGWYMTYALGGSRLSAMMQSRKARHRFQRATGLLFGLFGVLMLAKFK
jgi:threonine/homoserine/homoserine lactone efflux protein